MPGVTVGGGGGEREHALGGFSYSWRLESSGRPMGVKENRRSAALSLVC